MKFLLIIIFSLSSLVLSAQARLTIENNSLRQMTVKVMKGYGDGHLYKTVIISPNSSSTVYFEHSGYYFTKTKAILGNKEPVYQKGQPFSVTNNSTGYSVMTLTFSITESTNPQVMGGQRISKSEFDKD